MRRTPGVWPIDAQHDNAVQRARHNGSLYFQPDDVDLLWNDLKNKAPVVYPIENFTYGMREFAIRDNSGYILQFGKPIE